MAAIKYVKFVLGAAIYGVDIRKWYLTGQILSKLDKETLCSMFISCKPLISLGSAKRKTLGAFCSDRTRVGRGTVGCNGGADTTDLAGGMRV